MICLTLMESSIESNFKVLEKNRHLVDMAELRLDMLIEPLAVAPDKVKLDFEIPLIITYRKKIDGGGYEGSELFRRDILYSYAVSGFAFIDLELGSSFPEVEKAALEGGTGIIRSYHNFNEVPDNLDIIIRELASIPGEIPKVAVYPGSSSETLKFFKVFEKTRDIKEKIILGMGEFGIPSRILYKQLGSLISYCSGSDNSGAPGQITPGDMKNLYRADKINNSTAVYGVIGNPVMHSRSPRLHNKAYQRALLNAVYIPFKVDDVGSFFKLASLIDIRGFSVTVPHKVNVIEFINEQSPEVDRILSCNTVSRSDMLWKGYNTDMDGFLLPLISKINTVGLKNSGLKISSLKKGAVIGAGGAARAVITALQSLDMKITIFNRSESRGTELASETGSSFSPLSRIDLLSDFDIIVQTTTVGMTPEVDSTPLPGYKFRKNQIAYDIIYTPLETKFLKDAKSAGSITIGGMAMLQAQGIRQFEIFTDRQFPLEEQKESF
ncbi:MAG: shikimate dehydrogenase [Spirochaetales bacterium]|nr:shikimate dehydrogenase [Spirochaetales bacterium]